MKVGLFFGSFNPIHVGHLVLANYFAEFTALDEVWMVVSPHNPLKEKSGLLKDQYRLDLVRLAIEDYPRLKASNIEFRLPQPSYTVNTLAHLTEKYPQHEFSLILGADNLQTFDKWKNYQTILDYYSLYVYPRPGFDGGQFKDHPKVAWAAAPLMEVSSTFIRNALKEKKDVRFFLSSAVYNYIREMHFYEK